MAKVIRGEGSVSCEMKKLFKTSEGYLNTVAYQLLSKIDTANIADVK